MGCVEESAGTFKDILVMSPSSCFFGNGVDLTHNNLVHVQVFFTGLGSVEVETKKIS